MKNASSELKNLTFNIPELKSIYENQILLSEVNFQDKRYFEILVAQAVSTCDYKRLKIYINTSLNDLPSQNYQTLPTVYHTVGIITLLTRVAIIDGVSEKKAYSLSDTYLTLDFQKINVSPQELLWEIFENFTKLIENYRYLGYDSPFVTRIIKHIRNNINDKYTLEGLSALFGVTPEYLSSHFKSATGISLRDFINSEKIEQAKLLLITTDLSILDIALSLGYFDQSYFSKVFKKYVSLTPLQYKKKGTLKLKSKLKAKNTP